MKAFSFLHQQRLLVVSYSFLVVSAAVSWAQPSLVQNPSITAIKDDPFTSEDDTALRGTWGGEVVSFNIQYSGDTAITSLDSNDLEFMGLSGDATGKSIPVVLTESISLGEQVRGTYEVGPFDATANGIYVFRLKANEVHDGGDPPVSIPETEFFQFEQDITDPVPGVSGIFIGQAFDSEGNITYGVQGEFGMETRGLIIYYNQAVDWDSIDINDITIEGISGDALGHTYPVLGPGAFFQVSQIEFGASVSFGPLLVDYNGTYSVKIAPNEVFDRGDPKTALEPLEIFTFVQNVTNPYSATFEGRAFLETGTPKFEDDGWETDPGLDLNFHLETAQGGGYGYHRIFFWKSIVGNKPTGYESTIVDVVEARSGVATNGSFDIAGDQSLIFPVGAAIVVSESNGNNGTYTVSSVDVSGNVTRLGVGEAVPVSGVGGNIARAYTANITIDGEEIPVSFSGVESQTFQQIIFQLNAVLGDRGYAAVVGDFSLHVESPSYGPSSMVSISDPGGINGLFSNLPDYGFQESIPGNEDFYFLWQNEFYSEENLEQDEGRFKFTLDAPGIYRIKVWAEETYDEELQQTVWNPPDSEWIEQALGDPTRSDSPKDYLMYVLAKRSRSGEVIVRNFPFIEVNGTTDQIAANDDFSFIEVNAQNNVINILANDTVEAGSTNDQLQITSLGTPTHGGRVSLSGQNVYYTPPANYSGEDSFTYTITNGAETDSAKVDITVIPQNLPVPDDIYGLAWLLTKIMESTPQGSQFIQNHYQHRAELQYLLMNQGIQNQSAMEDPGTRIRIQAAGEQETEEMALDLLALALPGLQALVAGKGGEVLITQEMADKSLELRAIVLENASPQLAESMHMTEEILGDVNEFVGQSFEETALDVGLDPDAMSFPTLLLNLSEKVFSITTYDAAGLLFKLWKSTNLQPDSWEEVTNAEITTDAHLKILTDPDSEAESIFYRVSGELEP